ncbi:protein YgfX [uncultured Amphritea sp.]|jgi:toxin CptA|uniref:protein YgfX n=1 Tax=uncultured Amphritea sp. TaxID=981605 RepID=UPI003434D859
MPSVVARGVFLLLTALSFFSLWTSGLSVTFQFILSILCICYLAFCWPRVITLTHPRCVTGIRWLAERKTVVVCLGEGDWREVEVIQQRLNYPLLLGLKLKLRGQSRSVSVVIWRDSVTADHFRKLRVLLRFAPPPVSASHS